MEVGNAQESQHEPIPAILELVLRLHKVNGNESSVPKNSSYAGTVHLTSDTIAFSCYRRRPLTFNIGSHTMAYDDCPLDTTGGGKPASSHTLTQYCYIKI